MGLELDDFARNYTSADREEFAFQWNGKVSDQFEDENEEIRVILAEWVLDHPDEAPLDLIRDILSEDILWVQQSWRPPGHAKPLIDILIRRNAATPQFLHQLHAAGLHS